MKHVWITIMMVLALSLDNAAAQSQWIIQGHPTTSDLYSLSFLDSQTGWVAGDSGTILRTTDGGETWVTQNSTTAFTIVDLKAIGGGFAWAVARGEPQGYGTDLLKTTDGGSNWFLSSTFYDEYYVAVDFVDSLHGIMGGEFGELLWTEDGGSSWTPATVDPPDPLLLPVYRIEMYDALYGFASGGDRILGGQIWKTTDGGRNWEYQHLGRCPFQGICFIDSLNVVFVGGCVDLGVYSGVARTSNAGISWEYADLGLLSIPTSVSFRTSSEGWAPGLLGDNSMVTSDSGRTWSLQPVPTSLAMYDAVFVDSSAGFIVGEQGTVLKYMGPTMAVNEENQVLPKEMFLFENYPNPFNPSTTIRFSLLSSGDVSLKIFNLLGEEVATLVFGNREAGTHIAQWDATGQPSGMYFYRLQAGDFIETKKLILLR